LSQNLRFGIVKFNYNLSEKDCITLPNEKDCITLLNEMS